MLVTERHRGSPGHYLTIHLLNDVPVHNLLRVDLMTVSHHEPDSNNLQCTPEIKTFEYSTHEHKVKTANQVQSTFSQSLSLPFLIPSHPLSQSLPPLFAFPSLPSF